jgi:hypothetical protein
MLIHDSQSVRLAGAGLFREESYCWLIVDGWFGLFREKKYRCWLVVDGWFVPREKVPVAAEDTAIIWR